MNLIKNKTFQNIIFLSMGTIGAQIINFLGQIFITRIYLPEVLGEFTLILSFVQLIVPISSLRMEMKLVAAENKEEANRITSFSILLNCLVFATYYLFILINEIFQLGFLESIGYFIYFIPFMIFTNGLRYIFISYSNYENQYKVIGHNQFIRELIFIGLQIILGIIWPNTIVVVLSFIVSPLFGVKEQGLNYFNSINIKNEFVDSVQRLLENFKKFKTHILYQVPSQFANTFSYTIITLTIAKIATESDIAFYNFSVRILMIPLILISTNLSKVYMKEMADFRQKGGNYFNFHLKISGVLILIAALGFIILYNIAPIMMGILFGELYAKSGIFISILCLMYAVRFITSSLVGAFIIFNKQEIDFIFQIILCIVGIGLSFWAQFNNVDVLTYLRYANYLYSAVYLFNFMTITGLVFTNYKNMRNIN